MKKVIIIRGDTSYYPKYSSGEYDFSVFCILNDGEVVIIDDPFTKKINEKDCLVREIEILSNGKKGLLFNYFTDESKLIYKIITSNNNIELEKIVLRYLNAGFKLYGHPQIALTSSASEYEVQGYSNIDRETTYLYSQSVIYNKD